MRQLPELTGSQIIVRLDLSGNNKCLEGLNRWR